MPKVSVLIPIYNSEKFLDKCITSVIEQSLLDIEIILINDGSNDSSLEIAKKYATDKRVRIIDKKNSGYGASLNLGIQESQGEYISIVESDDFIAPDMLEKLYSKSNYDVIKCGFYYYPNNIQYKLNINGPFSLNDAPYAINIKPSVWSCLYKKDFLIQNDIKFNESKGASYQDVFFHFATLYSACNIYFLDEPLYFYRTDNNSSSVKSKKNPNAIIKEFNLIDEFLEDKNVLPETMAQILLFRLKAYIWNFMRIAAQFENEFIMNFNKDFKKQNNHIFFQSNFIKLKDKLKLFLILYNPCLLKILLNIVKKYTK